VARSGNSENPTGTHFAAFGVAEDHGQSIKIGIGKLKAPGAEGVSSIPASATMP
jgi:hypothetical protein